MSFSIERSEVFAFLAPNGAGKTTTVRMLRTLTRPDGGHASVAGGFDVARQPTAVLTTRYMDEAEYADRLAITEHGSIVASGTADELKRQVGAGQ